MDILSEYEYLYGDLIDFSKANVSLADVSYVDYRKKKSKPSENETKTPETLKESPVAKKEQRVKKELDDSYSNEAKSVYSVLCEEPTHIDDILRQTALKMSDVLSALTELELMGDVKSSEGKKYSI